MWLHLCRLEGGGSRLRVEAPPLPVSAATPATQHEPHCSCHEWAGHDSNLNVSSVILGVALRITSVYNVCMDIGVEEKCGAIGRELILGSISAMDSLRAQS